MFPNPLGLWRYLLGMTLETEACSVAQGGQESDNMAIGYRLIITDMVAEDGKDTTYI